MVLILEAAHVFVPGGLIQNIDSVSISVTWQIIAVIGFTESRIRGSLTTHALIMVLETDCVEAPSTGEQPAFPWIPEVFDLSEGLGNSLD